MSNILEVIFLLCFSVFMANFGPCSSSTTQTTTVPTTLQSTETTTATKINNRLCYACADSTDLDGNNACQNNREEMMIESGHRLGQLAVTDSKRRESHLKNIDYIKNCSSFGVNFTYCMIQVKKREDTGKVSSYIRDCSDGKSFSPGVLLQTPIVNMLQTFQTGNVTISSSGKDHFLYTVTICDSDFCNGPVPHSDGTIISLSFTLLFLLPFSIFIPTVVF